MAQGIKPIGTPLSAYSFRAKKYEQSIPPTGSPLAMMARIRSSVYSGCWLLSVKRGERLGDAVDRR